MKQDKIPVPPPQILTLCEGNWISISQHTLRHQRYIDLDDIKNMNTYSCTTLECKNKHANIQTIVQDMRLSRQ